MQRTIDGVVLEVMVGDIADQRDVDAVVNAANAQLEIGGGVAGAIHRAAGPELAEECRPLAPIEPGQCVITGAHGLPNRHVVHCLGPVYGQDEPGDELLASCYRQALRLADDQGLTSIAFPAISAGAFGYPSQPAAEVAWHAIRSELADLANVRLVRLVLFSEAVLTDHRAALEQLD